MLARVTPKGFASLPGVFIPMPASKKAAGGKNYLDPELTDSNVLSVGEGVLLRWLSYHLEQVNKVNVLGVQNEP